MKVLPNYNSLFHRCINTQYPPKARNVEECSKLITPYLNSFRGRLELFTIKNRDINTTISLHCMSTSPHYEEYYIVLDSNEDSVLVMENYPPRNMNHISYQEVWGTSSSTSWNTSTLKNYLNTTYLNSFGSHLQENIVETEFGKVFLLSENEVKNKTYFKYKQFLEIYDSGTSVDWWLRDHDPSDPNKARCVSNGNVVSKNVTDSLYIRPVFWLKKSYLLDDYITPLYNQSVEFDYQHRLCIREQFSNHNEPISSGDLYRAYEKVKPNIALFYIGDHGYIYNFPFRQKKYIEVKQQDGLYITKDTIYKISQGDVIKKYFNETPGFLFYGNTDHEEIAQINNICIYLDCCYDLDPIIWKYLPYLGTWLGEEFPNYLSNLYNRLAINFTQYI